MDFSKPTSSLPPNAAAIIKASFQPSPGGGPRHVHAVDQRSVDAHPADLSRRNRLVGHIFTFFFKISGGFPERLRDTPSHDVYYAFSRHTQIQRVDREERTCTNVSQPMNTEKQLKTLNFSRYFADLSHVSRRRDTRSVLKVGSAG